MASAVALSLIVLSILWRKKTERVKGFLFLGIAVPIVAATLLLAGSTVYLNLTSVSGGPVHWHADFQVWACGEELDLIDPTGLANRVGSPVFHEHGDNRIHVEGVVTNFSDASLGKFFGFVGGKLHEDQLSFPTNEGVVTYESGDFCPPSVSSGQAEAGVLQVFVWQTEGDEFYQTKLEDPENYVLSPFSTIPPGDCLIIEFGERKEGTEKLCDFYQIAEQKGELKRR